MRLQGFGSSADWYPYRYIGPCDSLHDFGYVHSNSGIANLAFKLMVTGGRHPRGRSTVNVPALGFEAAQVWYLALRYYMPSTANFKMTRWATAQAAVSYFGRVPGSSAPVHAAWDAVGVPR